jgi:hypothetical protein
MMLFISAYSDSARAAKEKDEKYSPFPPQITVMIVVSWLGRFRSSDRVPDAYLRIKLWTLRLVVEEASRLPASAHPQIKSGR